MILSARAMALASVATIFFAGTAQAQSADATPPVQQAAPEHPAQTTPANAAAAPSAGLGLDDIIVTGTSRGQTKFATSYAITTLSSTDIAQKAPLSLADLISGTPGLYVESSGGEVGNNVYSRGLPNDNFRYIQVLEDGLPVWEEGSGAFTNTDEFYRVDETVQSAQIVRGGSASITASNAPGGVINILTKRGTKDFQGVIKAETGDYDHYRIDGNISGPIAGNLSFAIGGFYRQDNGLRDPGFNGNKGGQFRASLNYDMDDGGSVYVGFRKLDDRNIFYTPIPLASTKTGLPGLDAGSGTLVNTAFDNIAIPDGNGNFTKRFNLTDGVHSNTNTFTLLIDKPIGDSGITLNEKFRYVQGVVDFNGLFSSTDAPSQAFLDSALTQLKAARPDTVSAVYRDASNGQTVAANALGNQLALDESLFNANIHLDNIINDFGFAKTFGSGTGSHKINIGWYYSAFHQHQAWNFNDILLEAINRPRYFNVVGLNAAGQTTISLTDNGLLKLHSGLQDFHDDVVSNALYATDSWQVTRGLRIDAGVRYQHTDKEGTVAQTAPRNLGDPTTLADDSEAVFTGAITPYSFKTTQWAYSVGGNYEFSPQVATFARYSRSFRISPESQQWFGGGLNVEDKIDLYEGGVKYNTQPFSAFVTLFYNNFPSLSFQTLVTDPTTGAVVSQAAKGAAKTKGVEVEFSLRPVSWFDVEFGGNYQDLKYASFAGIGTGGIPFSFSGDQIVRQPKETASVRPAIHLFDKRLDVYSEIAYSGKRFVDVANTIVLPAYTEVRVGANMKATDRLSAQIIVTNLFNEVGLTEGNPRAGAIVGTNETAFQGRPIFGRRVRGGITYTF